MIFKMCCTCKICLLQVHQMFMLELVAYRVEVENSKVAPLFFLALQVRYTLTNDYEKVFIPHFGGNLKF